MATMLHAKTGAQATATRVVGLVGRVFRVAASLVRARRHRREVADLLRLNDRMLRDVGLVRSDVLGALAEPAYVDPSIGLRLRRVEHRIAQRDREDQMVRLKARPIPARAAARLAA